MQLVLGISDFTEILNFAANAGEILFGLGESMVTISLRVVHNA